MKSKCKTCGRNCENGEYCFQHKSRKALANNGKGLSKTRKSDDGAYVMRMQEFFLDIWENRKEHNCENCKKWLGKEPLSYMFDHTLEKNKYPELKYEEENIMLLCLECHDNKTRGNLSELVRHKIEEVKNRFDK
jgi:5-methylcytosine-specific restriction endonuclease McrA